MPLLRYFRGSILFSLLCLLAAAWWTWSRSGSVSATLGNLWVVVVLAVLEISLSFDNAVVNAAVLADMDKVWRQRFLTWGMLIAVFGARVLFPLLIVGLTAGLNPAEALELSLEDPNRYAALLAHAHIPIAGFGGAFLALVGLNFFLDPEKDLHWLGWLERPMQRAGHIRAFGLAVVLTVLLVVAHFLPREESYSLLASGVVGVIAFVAVEGLGHVLQSRAEARALAGVAARSGLGAFLYLNVLDASFSLDGVIGAFALSNNMVIIALGLSIGALFVRSLTMLMVERRTLEQYRFLEHGAFWAILALAAIMFLSTHVEVPETVTGLIGAVLIGAAIWRSRKALAA